MTKLRVLHFIVQPVLVWDDGSHLAPGPVVEPQALTLHGLRDLVDNWPAKLRELEAKASSETAVSTEPAIPSD